MVRLDKGKPTPIGKPDRPARSFCKVSPGTSGPVEQITRLIGGAEGRAVGFRPLVDRKMLQRAHSVHPPRFLLGRITVSATRSRMRRRDRFSISSIQLADLGRYLSGRAGARPVHPFCDIARARIDARFSSNADIEQTSPE